MKVWVAGGAIAVLLVLALVIAFAGKRPGRHDVRTSELPEETRTEGTDEGFLYGRVTTVDGATYEGRLRFGGAQEAFWNDVFNGVKRENPWAASVPEGRRPKERLPLEIFGIKLGEKVRPLDLTRPFTAPFGEIVRIDAHGEAVRVTLKSGTVLDVNRFDASDFDDGVRVWDASRGVVDLDAFRIGAIEFLPSSARGRPPRRLHGTVHTKQGELTGFIAWDREKGVSSDALIGRTAEGGISLPFETVRSVVHGIGDGARVTLEDGREIEISGLRGRGIYVDDRRFGRVLVSAEAYERVDFDSGGSGPAYGDFVPGRPLTGTVTTKEGRRVAGRLVFDLDESETTDTLDAPSEGVDYAIPFGMIASIVAPDRITLMNGETVQLERSGDLGAENAGMLIFVPGAPKPEYVPWSEIERVQFEPVRE